jgi:hypothetical protein
MAVIQIGEKKSDKIEIMVREKADNPVFHKGERYMKVCENTAIEDVLELIAYRLDAGLILKKHKIVIAVNVKAVDSPMVLFCLYYQKDGI